MTAFAETELFLCDPQTLSNTLPFIYTQSTKSRKHACRAHLRRHWFNLIASFLRHIAGLTLPMIFSIIFLLTFGTKYRTIIFGYCNKFFTATITRNKFCFILGTFILAIGAIRRTAFRIFHFIRLSAAFTQFYLRLRT